MNGFFMNKVYAVILSAGSGERMGFATPKQFLKLAGRTVIEHTLWVFESHPRIDEIFVVVGERDRIYLEELLLKNDFHKITKILNGGKTRKQSSYVGINAVREDDAYILLHDSVRPFVSHRVISEVIDNLEKYPAVDVAIPSADTIIRVDEENLISDVPRRAALRRGQTPQGFWARTIKKAHELALGEDNLEVTDDCSLVLRYNLGQIYVVRGEEKNIKITYPEDLFLADKIFQINMVRIDNGIELENLKDKVLVVFGASRGIGKSILKLARRYGARGFGFSRKNGVAVQDMESVRKALKDVAYSAGRIDFIANTAGVLNSGKLMHRDLAELHQEIEINYLGSINVVKAGLEHLEQSKGSIALFTSSSYTRGRALYTVYSSTKAAIVNLVQGLAEEIGNMGVRINAVNPERTATPMRFENFGQEAPETLLDPDKVAEATLKTMLSGFTGMVVDVRKESRFPGV